MANCKYFSNSPLVFIKRDGNKVAHQLVIIAFDLGERVWVEEVPY